MAKQNYEHFPQGNVGFNFDNSYARLPESLYSFLDLDPVPAPQEALINDGLADSLGLSPQALRSETGIAILAGSESPPGGLPLAQAYAGHQFGHFTMLGDGRALLLGEHLSPSGQRYDLQLKGSGRTPYSRGGDGKATLGPMLREYIISEAMHGLNIPTTRSLAVVTTGEKIRREDLLPGAVLTRVASSHLRVGTFQYVASRGDERELRLLADYAMERHYPDASREPDKYLAFYREVIRAQASLIAQWMLVGFIHGVMNTDNMTISGETIDYGPCAFMDTFDPSTVFSSIDTHGRYAYANQPKIATWNLARLAETLLPLLDDDQEKARSMAEGELKHFSTEYDRQFLDGMRSKLGLTDAKEEDKVLVRDLLQLMAEHKADYTNTFLELTFKRFDQSDLCRSEEFKMWQKRWEKRLEEDPGDPGRREGLMRGSNAAVIPRNHRVEEALRPAVQDGDYGPVKKLLEVLKNPFAHGLEQKKFAAPPDPDGLPYRTFCGT